MCKVSINPDHAAEWLKDLAKMPMRRPSIHNGKVRSTHDMLDSHANEFQILTKFGNESKHLDESYLTRGSAWQNVRYSYRNRIHIMGSPEGSVGIECWSVRWVLPATLFDNGPRSDEGGRRRRRRRSISKPRLKADVM